MENNHDNVLLHELVEKRRILSELRNKVIIARESSDNVGVVNQSEEKGGQDSYITILKMYQRDKGCKNNTLEDVIMGDDSQVDFHFDSDDSVMDKNYEPNDDDYNSSCSQISNSPTLMTSASSMDKVKRRIFSPEKLHEKIYQLPAKRHISSLSENGAPETFDNISDLITLEDLIGQPNKSPDNFGYFLPRAKKSCLQKVIINENGNMSSEESLVFSPQKNHSKSLVVYQANISKVSDISLPPKNIENSSRFNCSDYNSNTPLYDVMAVDCDGIIYMPNNNTLRTDKESCKLAIKHKVKKAVVNPSKWKRNQSKIARLKGSPYRSTVARKKIEVEGRMIKAPCSCKAKCNLKLTEDQRQLIFHQFWKQCGSWDQRRQYIVTTVKKDKKRLMKTDGNLESDRRKYSYTYSLTIGDLREKVCKVMYLNTLSIGEKFVKISIEKQLEGGLTIGDQRGKHDPGNKSPELMIKMVIDHIKSYPSYESHYSRQKTEKKYLGPDLNIATMYAHYKIKMEEEKTPKNLIAKESLYRYIFNTKFNLSFKLPSIDTCDDCDAFQNKLKDTIDETERKIIEKEWELHSELAEQRYKLKMKDKEEAMISSGKKKVLMFDLQKCLATPNLTNTKSFYLRKLWTLNLTIYDATENTATNLLWSENISGRGGNEIASCLLRWANENKMKIANIEELTLWSDNCAGQNRNFMIVSAYVWLLHEFKNLRVINHKFMLKGHTHMEVDQIHAQIERKKKQLKTMQIAIPRDWSQFIQTCGGKRSFDVFNMTLAHFKDLTSLYKNNGPLVQRKKNLEGIEFKISECVCLQLRQQQPGVLYYKKNFSDEFSKISLLRNASRGLKSLADLPCLRNEEKPISSAKYKDLITLLEWVPQEFHGYYKNLKHCTNESDFPEAD